MRILFMAVIAILFQLCTYALASGVQWLVRPWASDTMLKAVMIGLFVISNIILALLIAGSFRLGMSYLSMMWIAVMAMALTLVLGFVASKAGITLGHSLRAFGVVSFIGLIGLGLYNVYTPTVRHLSISIDKPMPAPVRLAMVSDLHLGELVGIDHLDKLAKILQDEQVDLLLIPGDVMDDDTVAYDALGMASHFKAVVDATRYGAVASLGNHDLYRRQAQTDIITAITDTGAVLLDDKTTQINIQKDGQTTSLSVIGRFDDHYAKRLDTKELLEQVDITKPVILLDHRPSQIDDNSQLPIDLQVSGHTHNGQIFPANFIVAMMNRIGYGYEQVGNMHTVVSSGYGLWGVPLRLGSQSEVWIIDMVGSAPK